MAELISDIDAAVVRANLERVRVRAGAGVRVLIATKYVADEDLATLAEAGVDLVFHLWGADALVEAGVALDDQSEHLVLVGLANVALADVAAAPGGVLPGGRVLALPGGPAVVVLGPGGTDPDGTGRVACRLSLADPGDRPADASAVLTELDRISGAMAADAPREGAGKQHGPATTAASSLPVVLA